MHWSEKYIGVPFAWAGDTLQGCSCWGLVCLVQREVFGRSLPSYRDFSKEMRDTGRTDLEPYFATSRPIELGSESEGDLLHMWTIRKGVKLPLHVGVILSGGRVLHVEEGAGSCVVNYKRDKRVQWRVIGAYQIA